MEKYKIFSKFNIKDYNNELEKILDNKLFSLEVKNLLLSMLYKIENAFKDYETVKVNTLPKKHLIENILQIIKEKCFDIELINLSDEKDIDERKNEEERLTFIEKEKGKIRCYPNEKSLLSAIWYMGEEDANFFVMYPYIENCMQEMIYIGNNMNQTEVIRDFNGWSWDILVKEIEDIPYNIVYQTLLLLDGKKLNYLNINQTIEDDDKESILIKDKKNEKFKKILYQLVMQIYLKNHCVEQEKIKQIKQEKQNQYELFLNKKEFIQKMTDEKKDCSTKIEKIDRMINNTELLRQEYIKRNKTLTNKEKIFSISHLEERLEKERQDFLEKIKRCNKLIEPKEFVKEKEKLEKEVEFLKSIVLDSQQNVEELNRVFITYINEFFKIIEKRIEKLEERNDIIEWVYKIRYYRWIPFDNELYLKDVKELETGFKTVIKLLIKKMQYYKIWDNFTEDEELTYYLIKNLLDTKIINLENINIFCKYENEILYIEYFDGNILEKKFQLNIKNIRIKKRIKLFI